MANAYVDFARIDLTLPSREIKNSPLLQFGRPWLVVLFDSCFDFGLAWTFSFNPPCADSVLAVLRDCVHRHHRLPVEIVVPNGRSFCSDKLLVCLASLGIVLKHPPVMRPQYGAAIDGIIYSFRNAIEAPTNDSNEMAAWNLDSYAQAAESYFYDVYNRMAIDARHRTRRDAYISLAEMQHGGIQFCGLEVVESTISEATAKPTS